MTIEAEHGAALGLVVGALRRSRRLKRALVLRSQKVTRAMSARFASSLTRRIVFLNLGGLISGAVVTETVFDWPGIVRLLIDAVRYRDYPTIQQLTLLSIFGVLSAHLLAAAIIVYLDPRMRGHL